jgi:hypothetical protein
MAGILSDELKNNAPANSQRPNAPSVLKVAWSTNSSNSIDKECPGGRSNFSACGDFVRPLRRLRSHQSKAKITTTGTIPATIGIRSFQIRRSIANVILAADLPQQSPSAKHF